MASLRTGEVLLSGPRGFAAPTGWGQGMGQVPNLQVGARLSQGLYTQTYGREKGRAPNICGCMAYWALHSWGCVQSGPHPGIN